MIRNSKERVEEGPSLSTFCHRGGDAHILEELLDWDLLCSKFGKYRKMEENRNHPHFLTTKDPSLSPINVP